MRGAISLVILLIVPLASGIITQIDLDKMTSEGFGEEIILYSPNTVWNQNMWNDIENNGFTPLRLISPNELLVWRNWSFTPLDGDLIIKQDRGAEWRGVDTELSSFDEGVWVVFEPNLPNSAAQELILKFEDLGLSIDTDLNSYNSAIPHKELVGWAQNEFDVEYLLGLDGVLWLEPNLHSEARNIQSSGLMGDGTFSQPVQWSLGLNGTGVVLGIADSGLDYDHACFRNATAPGSFGSNGEAGIDGVGVFGKEHRKVLLVNETIDSSDAMGHINFRHGTHTTGTLACFDVYSYRNGGVPSNGSSMSHNAKLVVQDIVSSEGWLPPDNVSELLSEAAFLGGVIHSNSWGDDTTSYTARSGEFDAWSVEMPWSLAFIAPGNTGGGLLEPANARNVVAIGASTKSELGERWGSSSIGPTEAGTYGIFALAPGISIQSAEADGISDSYNDDLRSSSGTSMSTPMAASFAGVIQQMVQDGWLMGSNENLTAIDVSTISPEWANLPGNSIMLGEGFVPSGLLLKSILSLAVSPLNDSSNYSTRNNESGFGVFNLSELIDIKGVVSGIGIGNVSPSEDVWIHDSFRLENGTPMDWLKNRSDGDGVLDDLVALPWDGSGAVGPFLGTGQNWTKRLVPNGEDLDISMAFPSAPEPYLVDDLQLIVRLSNGYVAVGDYYDGDGFSTWFNSTIDLGDVDLFPNKNETSVGVGFSSLELEGIDWIDVEVRARYISPGDNPGFTGIEGDRVGFALAVKGVVRDSLNWGDGDGDGFANIEDECPNENPQQWDGDGDGCIDDSDGDGIKDPIDLCISENSSGYDLNQDGCIDDSDGDGVKDSIDLCETFVIDSVFPVDSMGCRPVDNPPEIYQYSISGIDDGLWNGDLFVSWSVKDLDGDLFDAGARVLLHQNLSEQSSFSIAGCDFVQRGENETFACSWHVPEDLPIFDIKEKEMHIQVYVQSVNASPEADNTPKYFDDNNVFKSDWENPLLENNDEQKGAKDEDWGVSQTRALMWGILGLIGIGVFMGRLWSVNVQNSKGVSGEFLEKTPSAGKNEVGVDENE